MQAVQGRAGAAVWLLLGCAAVAASCTSSQDTAPLPGAAAGKASDATDGAGARNAGAQSGGGSLSLDDGASRGDAGAETETHVTPGDACAKSTEPTRALPAVLALVVDTSGSMDWPPGWAPMTPDDSKPAGATKWEITRDALDQAVAALSPEIALGASFYPNVEQEDDVCLNNEVALPIAELGRVGSAARKRWAEALAAVVPIGATPTHGAYRFGLSKLAESQRAGDKFLLLITDGTPTCDIDCRCTEDNQPVDPLPLLREAKTARTDGIRTFVIGSPGSEQARDVLSRLATEGGTAKAGCSDSGPRFCHFDMTTEPDLARGLSEALEQITSQVRSCSYPIPAPPQGESLDSDLVNVLFTAGSEDESETIPRAPAQEACAEGWQYASDGQSITLCPDSCARAQADAESRIEILFGCETVVQKPR